MSARAVWRVRHGDPTSWLGWLVQDAARILRIVERTLERCLYVAAFLLACDGHWIAAFVAAILASVPAILVQSLADWDHRRLPVGPLLTLPPPSTPFPCRIELFRRDALIGRDLGIVTFVDGWLVFEGCRTAFSLRRADASERKECRVEIAEGGEIVFYPEDRLVADGLNEEDLAKRFKANLASWWRSDSPPGESVLPPMIVHPSGPARAWLDLATSLVLLTAALPFAFRLAAHLGFWTLLLLLPLGRGFTRAASNLDRVRRAPLALPKRREVR